MSKQLKVCVFAPEIHDTISGEIISGILNRSVTLSVEITIVSAGKAVNQKEDFNKSKLYKDVIKNSNFDGIIILTGAFTSGEITSKELESFLTFIPKSLPVVSLSVKLNGFVSILSDNTTPIFNIVNHLINVHDKKTIMFIKGPEGQPEAEDRFKGYCSALKEHDIEIDEQYIFRGDFTPHKGANAVKDLLEMGIAIPEAIVCADDDTALGVYAELKRNKIDFSNGGIAITGFDNMGYTRTMDPRLTTVAQSFTTQGIIGLNTLISVIGETELKDTFYQPKVLYRESCGCTPLFHTEEKYTDLSNKEIISSRFDDVNIDGFEDHIDSIDQNINQFVIDDTHNFIPIIEEYIRMYRYKGYNLKILLEVIHQISGRVILKLDRDQLIYYLNQVEQVTELIVEAINNEKSREFRNFSEQSSELDSILMNLATCMSYSELKSKLDGNFFYLGIKSISLNFNGNISRGLEVLDGVVFEKDDSLNRSKKQYCSLYLPISSKSHTGYCNLRILLNSFHIGEVLSFQISRALYLIDLFNSLNDKIHEVESSYSDLRSAKDMLTQSEQLATLGGLVAGFTHEISTPIGVGVTATSYASEEFKSLKKAFVSNKLKKSDMGDFIENTEKTLDIIMTNLKRTSALINGFKQIAVDQASEVKREFELSSYINDVFSSLSPMLHKERYNIIVDVPGDIVVNSYPGAVSQIITNLVQNSIRHGFENQDTGEIHLLVKKTKKNLLVTYSDTGCGINKENLSKVFESYYSTKIGKGGSGLGLSIVKQLVEEKLGGTIACESIVGKGTKFILTIAYP
ncbi:MAG: ATP-binding protein [Spirochaetaceae bacterium]